MGRPPRRALALLACASALACRGGDVSSSDPERRARAVRAAVDRGDPASLAVLLVAEGDPSPVVRLAAAEAFGARGGPGSADALGKLLLDRAPEVAAAAARGLSAMPKEPRAHAHLVGAYAGATPAGRAAIADALERIGVSLREAVEQEARVLWERHLAALETGRGAIRAGAAEELGASSRTDAVQRLVPLVDPNRNADPVLAAAAARGLGESGDWAARPFLEPLLEGRDASLAETAAAALGRLGDPAAADALAAAAVAQGGRLAAAAGEALAALPDAPGVGIALCELAIRTDDPGISRRAARAARGRDTECPERPLFAKLGRSGTEAALAAIAELRLGPQIAGSAVERVAALLDPGRAPDAAVRAAAARTLSRLGTPAAGGSVARRLEIVLARVSGRRVRWIRGPAPPASAPPEWIDAVSAGDVRELGALLAAAGGLRIANAETLLVPLTRDPAAGVRAGAVEGLARLGSVRGFDAVAAALGDPDGAVRIAAASGLARFGARGAAALVRAAEAAPGGSPEWTDSLAVAMGETGSAEAIPALAQLLDGPSAAAAAAALAHLGAPGAAPALVAFVARPEARARAAAIDALAQLVARDAGPAIAELLTDDSPEVRAEAARALGRLGYEAASRRLEALRSDYYGRVRRVAVDALAKLPAGGARARP